MSIWTGPGGSSETELSPRRNKVRVRDTKREDKYLDMGMEEFWNEYEKHKRPKEESELHFDLGVECSWCPWLSRILKAGPQKSSRSQQS